MKYDTLVLIGRFQPVHNAHVEIIRRARTMCRELIIIIGSAKQPRTYKNPWSAEERKMMVQNALDGMLKDSCRIHIESNTDSVYNDKAWAMRVQGIVSKYRCLGGRTGIIGHKKDESSFYLDMFPQWDFEEVELLEPLNASDVRDLYFRDNVNPNFIRSVVPMSTMRMLDGKIRTPEWLQIVRERDFAEAYKSQYSSLPYAPVFVTTDAVVTCAGHVLMIKRRSEPGKGLLALPGGFFNANTDKSIQAAMLRELKEETTIKVPVPVLVGNIVKSQVFDAIGRSTRGRTITHAFHIDLGSAELPKVKGSDDAEKATWIAFADLDSSTIFEDHFEIITTMVGL